MMDVEGASLLHMLCDVARNAERADATENTRQEVRVSLKVEPAVELKVESGIEPRAGPKIAPSVEPKVEPIAEMKDEPKLETKVESKLESGEGRSEDMPRKGKDAVSAGAQKERKRKRDATPDLKRSRRTPPSPESHSDTPSSAQLLRYIDLENALKESNSQIYHLQKDKMALQQDKMALQQRCAEAESLLQRLAPLLQNSAQMQPQVLPNLAVHGQAYYGGGGWDRQYAQVPRQGYFEEIPRWGMGNKWDEYPLHRETSK
eukprot:Plantae.Rhodophyta-Purpureofilum_apyrenoidigerum.ctg48839.p1 GENE.Plantae.Rhodophyta-Purpureofilum_apyrenoidigerum.ctg48839~~Plantae.Rhodophyta-Purpureofilum_apyrenoidigerum.ctg48839.p1  ORF type:complete len:261 (-),score=42.70 Plantae.Rhodophyta-Purpureofilum_apyrenoidigerum.ctg48839:30-812(-)